MRSVMARKASPHLNPPFHNKRIKRTPPKARKPAQGERRLVLHDRGQGPKPAEASIGSGLNGALATRCLRPECEDFALRFGRIQAARSWMTWSMERSAL